MLHTVPSRPVDLPSARRPVRSRSKVAVVSTYPPRQCGIATFAHDLRHALAAGAPDLDVLPVAVDRDGLRYGSETLAVIDQDNRASYSTTAKQLADADVDAVLIQHEFGIFGGPDGAWITDLAAALMTLGIPYLVTLHTVLSQPSPGQIKVLRQLCHGATGLTVFTPTAARLAAATGIAAPGRFRVIPHGAPPVMHATRARQRQAGRPDPRVGPEVSAVLAGLRDATVVSTFGLLSPNKGLETGITAVARLAAELPRLRYVIAGATHPEIVRRHGEDHRQSLAALADDLGVADRVVFLDRFLSDAEIAALLDRTSVFLTPYRSVEQISSGALTFALAAGVPAVSTAYHYATDMLAGGAGTTVACGDTDAFTRALRSMLTEPGRLAKAASAARAAAEHLAWPAIANSLADLIRTAARSRTQQATSAPTTGARDLIRRMPLPGRGSPAAATGHGL